LLEFVRAGEQRASFGGRDWLEAKGALPPFSCAMVASGNDGDFIQTGFIQTGFIQTGFIQTGFIQTGFIQTG
jgi:hypothetical protein